MAALERQGFRRNRPRFSDLPAHSRQNGAVIEVQEDADNAIWLDGASASSVHASDFSIVS